MVGDGDRKKEQEVRKTCDLITLIKQVTYWRNRKSIRID